MTDSCPRCGGQVVHQEGCERCLECPWAVCFDGGRHVIVRAGGGTDGVYHEPDPEHPEEPKCNRSDVPGGNWRRRALGSLPDRYRRCKNCAGGVDRSPIQGGSDLAEKLAAMDPEDVPPTEASD